VKKLAIIYFSKTGNTEAMANLIAEGAKAEGGVEVHVDRVENFSLDRVIDFDGFVLGSPTYYGAMAGDIKDFLDKTVKFHRKLDGKVGAAFASAANIGGGNETTITGILNALLIHGMIIQGNPEGDHYGPVSIGAPDDRVSGQCRTLGRRVATLLKNLN